MNNPDKVKWEKFAKEASRELKDQIEEKNRMKCSTSFDDRLHICDGCDCLLTLKVWAPIEHIKATTDVDELHPNCWIRSELESTKKAFTLLELLLAIVLMAFLAGLLASSVSKAFKFCKGTAAKVEFAHFAKTVRWLDEPDPHMIDPATGKEVYYTTHPHFTNYLFTIEKW